MGKEFLAATISFVENTMWVKQYGIGGNLVITCLSSFVEAKTETEMVWTGWIRH